MQWKVWHLRVWVLDRAAVWSLSWGSGVMGLLPVQECCCPAVKQRRRIKRRGTQIAVILYPGVLSVGRALLSLELVINAPHTYSTLPPCVRPHLPYFNIGCGAMSMARYHPCLSYQTCYSSGGMEHSEVCLFEVGGWWALASFLMGILSRGVTAWWVIKRYALLDLAPSGIAVCIVKGFYV